MFVEIMQDYWCVWKLITMAQVMPVCAQMDSEMYRLQQMLIAVSYKLEKIGFEFYSFVFCFS